MHTLSRHAALAVLFATAAPAGAQPIIAQLSGLASPDHVIDFGANLFPNFTPVSTEFAGITITHARYFTTAVVNNMVGGFITNDPVGLPNTLKIKFANPITDLSFAYHQIGTSMPSAFRAMLGATVVDSFSNLSNQTQPNNYFGFTNILFDELQLDFVGDFNVDTLAFNDLTIAKCTLRNGSGINPVGYRCLTLPVLGTIWQSSIAQTVNTIASYIVIAPGGAHPGFPLLGGEVLVQVTPPPIFIPGSGTFSVPIPSTGNGVVIATQGLRVDSIGGTPTVVLLNAQDLTLGM